MIIRPEQPEDAPAIRTIHLAAFPTAAEADLVDALRTTDNLTISLVALDQHNAITGHIAFSPITIERNNPPSTAAGLGPAPAGLGLAPVAVHPTHHNRGIGSALITAGLGECRKRNTPLVVVLGDPAYYTRFGFNPASNLNLTSVYNAGDAFMALPLSQNADSTSGGGLIHYAPPFSAFE